jgi:cytochrome P450
MADPAEDMVSDLGKRVSNGDLSVREATQLGTGMLIAGHETTANMIGLGIAAL